MPRTTFVVMMATAMAALVPAATVVVPVMLILSVAVTVSVNVRTYLQRKPNGSLVGLSQVVPMALIA